MERNNGPRKIIEDLASRVLPLDEKEQRHQADILTWVRSGAPLFRTVPPTTPPQHLAVYFALFDEANRALMLVGPCEGRMLVVARRTRRRRRRSTGHGCT